MVATVSLEDARRVASGVPDPELPFLTVAELGILRDVTLEAGVVVAKLTPTYIGCPAVSVIENDVLQALLNAGFNAKVLRVDSPAWSTAWITQEGIEKLRSNGISPPNSSDENDALIATDALFTTRVVACPRCDSTQTSKVSEFGSTPCKAQYRCNNCLEPFDHFKCH